ncbi:MAG: 1-(5-phosphoribosyl)-5-[(5-phosphoribosylamino)methylideneamino]imidazole-4-carboxamide isomerase [Armatimonadetes bacterium]|nr:1-(5-phosphoribosyl)-5-[(5-phosphoribosylamino)methylideneamino]imidazole-4-carboxamide isomerase [Armatimonadota bacterium]
MLIIPAIDLIDNQCVRLYQGDYEQETRYDHSPVEMAKRFQDEGATWLHVVDLDGAKSGQPQHLNVLHDIVMQTELNVEFGGGVRSLETAKWALELGAKRVVIGTKLVQDQSLASTLFGSLGTKVVAGIDTRQGNVAIHGWTEDSGCPGVQFARMMQSMGCRRIIFTDVTTDGTMAGPNVHALKALQEALDIPIIASGGVGTLDDLRQLAGLGVEGVVVGKALYEREFTLKEAIEAVTKVPNT